MRRSSSSDCFSLDDDDDVKRNKATWERAVWSNNRSFSVFRKEEKSETAQVEDEAKGEKGSSTQLSLVLLMHYMLLMWYLLLLILVWEFHDHHHHRYQYLKNLPIYITTKINTKNISCFFKKCSPLNI